MSSFSQEVDVLEPTVQPYGPVHRPSTKYINRLTDRSIELVQIYSPRSVVQPSGALRKSSRKIFDEILVLADDLLKDECPISQVDEWLFRIDDTLLQLKLWGETVGVEQGLLEDIVLDKDLCLVIGEVLRSIILPLHKIEVWREDAEAVELPQIKSRISAAIDEFQASANSLTGTIELFRNYEAKSNKESFLQDFKPTSSITDHLYGAYDHQGQDSSVGKKAEEQQQRNSSIARLPSLPVIESSYGVFLQVLAKIPDQEKQVIRIGELPILREQILDRIMIYGSKCSEIHHSLKKFFIIEVAAALSQFYEAWLETASTINLAGSDAESRAHGLPHMAKIWLILHGMRQERLLDSFCACRMTDESLPLDILTLESILPLDENKYPSMFAAEQFEVVPPPPRLAARRLICYQGSAPPDEPYLGPPEAPSVNMSSATLSEVSFAGTTTPTGDPPVEETALNQPASTPKTFASTSSYTGDPTVEGTSWNQPTPTKKGFASTSSHTGEPTVDETLSLRQRR